MSQAIDDLKAEVEAAKAAMASAVALITNELAQVKDLTQRLADAVAAGDPAAIEAITADLKTAVDATDAAVAAASPPVAPPAG